jgi:hypothetical protein
MLNGSPDCSFLLTARICVALETESIRQIAEYV